MRRARQPLDDGRIRRSPPDRNDQAGVLATAEPLQPSAKAKRLVSTNHELRVIDGPFSESKELIGGFAILRLSDMDEAVALCQRYAAILPPTSRNLIQSFEP